MGNTVARQMIDRLSSSVDTGSGLGPLLEDPKFLQLCQDNIHELSTLARANLQALSEHRSENAFEQKVLQLTSTDIRLAVRKSNATDDRIPSLYQVYKTLNEGSRGRSDRIPHDRLQAVALYDIGDHLGTRDPFENLKSYMKHEENVNERESINVKKLRQHFRSGQRLKTLAEACGGLGVLLMIPGSILTIYQAGKSLENNSISTCIKHFTKLRIDEKAKTASAHVQATNIYESLIKGFQAEIKTCGWRYTRDKSYTEDPSDLQECDDEDKHMAGVPDVRSCGVKEVRRESLEGYNTVTGHSATGSPQDASSRAPLVLPSQLFSERTYSHEANTSDRGSRSAAEEYRPAMEGYQSMPRGYQPNAMSLAYGIVDTGTTDHRTLSTMPCYPQGLYPNSASKPCANSYVNTTPIHNAYMQQNMYQDCSQAMQPIPSQYQDHPSFPGSY